MRRYDLKYINQHNNRLKDVDLYNLVNLMDNLLGVKLEEDFGYILRIRDFFYIMFVNKTAFILFLPKTPKKTPFKRKTISSCCTVNMYLFIVIKQTCSCNWHNDGKEYVLIIISLI